MQHFEYRTRGTCSSHILIDIEDNKLVKAEYIGGCSGNTQGIAKLVAGMDIDEVIEKLSGIRCGMKETSCPDQLATALRLAKRKLAEDDKKEKKEN